LVGIDNQEIKALLVEQVEEVITAAAAAAV
jgi:hypothetical protein